ncbi:hypothetical protein [Allonocardiopsis opalescens]|uniref:Uncharacterized protein n=1 Tax=Allonocardiopsis opalescens TaxID=1144618 RepID=A0A2T0QCC7_9ACTN|nr:hypothetical protein [Allonocardiopsis opalescens]PRY01606.1 hypothetical protein CLV72_101189 [Allonocardiopsis opalescens]
MTPTSHPAPVPPAPGPERTPAAPDTGAAGVQYAALITLAGLLIAVVSLAFTNADIRGHVETALCRLFQLGESCETQGAQQYEPDACLLTSSTDRTNVGLTIAFVDLGKGYYLIREDYSDGTTHFTLGHEGEIGASAGWERTGGQGVSVEFQAEVGAAVGGGIGDTWVVDTDEADQLAGRFEDAIGVDEEEQDENFVDGVVEAAGDAWTAIVGADTSDFPPPHIRRTEGEVNVHAGASGGISTPSPGDERPTDRRPGSENAGDGPQDSTGAADGASGGGSGSGDPGSEGTTEDIGTQIADSLAEDVTPSASISGEIGATGSARIVREDYPDGAHSLTFLVSGRFDAGAEAELDPVIADAVGDEIGYTALRRGSLNIQYDPDGVMTGVTLTQIAVVNGEQIVTTTELAVETEGDRAVVEEWLGLRYERATELTWNDMAPSELTEDSSEFDRLLFEQARSSRVTYAVEETSEEALNESVEAGVGLGISAGTTGESVQLTGAEYLDRPGGGTREYTEWEDCS